MPCDRLFTDCTFQQRVSQAIVAFKRVIVIHKRLFSSQRSLSGSIDHRLVEISMCLIFQTTGRIVCADKIANYIGRTLQRIDRIRQGFIPLRGLFRSNGITRSHRLIRKCHIPTDGILRTEGLLNSIIILIVNSVVSGFRSIVIPSCTSFQSRFIQGKPVFFHLYTADSIGCPLCAHILFRSLARASLCFADRVSPCRCIQALIPSTSASGLVLLRISNNTAFKTGLALHCFAYNLLTGKRCRTGRFHRI